MFTRLPDPVKAAVFYVLSLGLAVAVAALPGVTSFAYMFTPLVAVLLVMFVVTRDGYGRTGWAGLGLHRPGVRLWTPAVAVPTLVMVAAFAALWATGLAGFVVPERIEGYRTEGLFWLVFPLVLVVSLLVNTLTNSLGEELGWRGYLLPRLASWGPVPALLITGVLHAAWHLPIMFMTTLYHADGDRLIVIPLFFASLTVAGVFLGWLRLASGSVWPAALGHTAHNLAWAVLAAFTSGDDSLAVEYLAGDSGLLIALGYALVGAWLIVRMRRGGAAGTPVPPAPPAPDGERAASDERTAA